MRTKLHGSGSLTPYPSEFESHHSVLWDRVRHVRPHVYATYSHYSTSGAASTAAKLGVPAAAFSGTSGSQVSYTTLRSDPNATSTLAARLYASLTTHFVQTLLSAAPDLQPASILPNGTILNVNYPSIDACPEASDYEWIFARNLWNPLAKDVETCGSTHLPDEASVLSRDGCFISVSVLKASSKADAGREVQADVLAKLQGLPLSCLP